MTGSIASTGLQDKLDDVLEGADIGQLVLAIRQCNDVSELGNLICFIGTDSQLREACDAARERVQQISSAVFKE